MNNTSEKLAFSYDPIRIMQLVYATYTAKLTCENKVWHQTISHSDDEFENFKTLLEQFLDDMEIQKVNTAFLEIFPGTFYTYLENKRKSSKDAYFKKVNFDLFTRNHNNDKYGVANIKTFEFIECGCGGHFNSLLKMLKVDNEEMYDQAQALKNCDEVVDQDILNNYVTEHYVFVRPCM